ncbi:MAG: 3'-5' exonuclease [Pseudomonadales bacterium]|nr:3'-5' exonuclease [Pseudomonadales bacterium]
MPNSNTLVVLDFETTGLSPNNGDRAIEIGAVRIENGKTTDTFQELMYPGMQVDTFIEEYTGITNDMLEEAAPCEEVMNRFADFIGDDNLVAHNASFDKRFLDSEFQIIDRHYSGEFACSLLLARRIFQAAPNHRLGTLVRYANIPTEGEFHRALYDSEMTAKLWLKMLEDISERYNIVDISFELIQKISSTPKKAVQKMLEAWV